MEMEKLDVVYCPGCGSALRELSEETGSEGHFTRGSTKMTGQDQPERQTYIGACGGCGFAFDILHRTTYPVSTP